MPVTYNDDSAREEPFSPGCGPAGAPEIPVEGGLLCNAVASSRTDQDQRSASF
jgi:hypothetical protein